MLITPKRVWFRNKLSGRSALWMRYHWSWSVRRCCKYLVHIQIKFGQSCPCHHGNARPRVTDGGDGLQKRRVAVNILNWQSPSFSLGVGRRA